MFFLLLFTSFIIQLSPQPVLDLVAGARSGRPDRSLTSFPHLAGDRHPDDRSQGFTAKRTGGWHPGFARFAGLRPEPTSPGAH